MEFLNRFGIVLLGIGWTLAAPGTFAYLIIQENKQYHDFLGWIGLIVIDMILSGIWPIYWLILHWIS